MSSRQRATLFILAALVLVSVLAAGLGNLELQTGKSFQIRDAAPVIGSRLPETDSGLWATFFRGLILLGLVFLPIYIIYMLIDPRRRKRLLAELLGFAAVFLMFYLLQNYLMNRPENSDTLSSEGMSPPSLENLGSPEIVEFDPQPSELAVSATAIGLGILMVGAAGLAWFLFAGRQEKEPKVLGKVAAEAEETLESLLAGKDLRETVLVCYRRMTEIVVKHRGIPREASVTPSEFQQVLIEKGLPAVAVRDLTHLFEDVRYGEIRADEDSRRRATLALRTIIAACRQKEETPA